MDIEGSGFAVILDILNILGSDILNNIDVH